MAGVECVVFGKTYNTRSEVLKLCNLSSVVVSRRAKKDNIEFDTALERLIVEKGLYVDGEFVKKKPEQRGPKNITSCVVFGKPYRSRGEALREFNVSHTSINNIMSKGNMSFSEALEKYALEKGLYQDGEIIRNVKGATRGNIKIVRYGIEFESLEKACSYYGITKSDIERIKDKKQCSTQIAFDYAVAKAEEDACIVFGIRYKNPTAAANHYSVPVRDVREYMKESGLDFGKSLEYLATNCR